MFENIIEQGATLQLRDDIINRRIAPSMLFYGPPDSGKGSAALELSRVLSCEQDSRAAWKCSCLSCEKHRYLKSDDLLVLGNRRFTPEISACKSTFLRNAGNEGAKLLFYRSLRKLLIRFSPVLMEDDPKLPKISVLLQSLDEELSVFMSESHSGNADMLNKVCGSLTKDAFALAREGLGGIIPIAQIRRASYWCSLAPNGKRKILIIENAENMKDEGRNSLLKLLEEPPPSVNIILTSQRRETIMPTILSRLRPYRFLKRSENAEKEVIRRVFLDSADEKSFKSGASVVSAYLGSFSSGAAQHQEAFSPGQMESLAAWFIVSLARITLISIKERNENYSTALTAGHQGMKLPENIYSRAAYFLNALTEHYALIGQTADCEQCVKSGAVIKILLSKCDNFKDVSISCFLELCLDMINVVTRSLNDPEYIVYNDIFRKLTADAVNASDVLNINAAVVMENLFFKLKRALIRG